MSFGFSVGDFLAVGNLILRITATLQDAGGAKSDYQELVRELESLNKALKHVDQLNGPLADSVKCSALMCRYPLEDFLNKISKFDKSLGTRSSVGSIKNAGRKLQWGFGKKDEVARLRDYLNLHIGSINMQLMTSGLETLGAHCSDQDNYQLEIRRGLEDSKTAIADLGSRVDSQSLLAQCTRNAVGTLFAMVRVDVVGPLKDLIQAVTKVCNSTQEIYFTVLEIRANMAGIDTRHSFFQEPIKIEDALGRIWPVPSEYSLNDLHAILLSKFVGQPGLDDVEVGNYELSSKSNQQIDTARRDVALLPGMHVIMAIIIQSTYPGKELCPASNCHSKKRSVNMPDGSRKCQTCGVCFNKTPKKRKRLDAIPSEDRVLEDCFDDSQSISESGFESPIRVTKKAKRSPNAKAESFAFKNIRIPEIPDESCMRVWIDSTGQFKVSAEFVGFYNDGRVALHKANGIRIGIPTHKLCSEDLAFIATLSGCALEELKSEAARLGKEWKNKLAWTDSTGYFKVEANYLKFQDGKVYLHKANSVKIVVPFDKLSLQGQEYVKAELGLVGQVFETTKISAIKSGGVAVSKVVEKVEEIEDRGSSYEDTPQVDEVLGT